MAQPIIQPSFAAGELSPSLYGRVDLAKFHSGAALMRNFFADYRGGASSRPGTSYVGPCLPGVNRLVSFTFSTVQTYSLVFSDKAMRVVMDGALVLEPGFGIFNIPVTDGPCVVATTGGDTGWSVGDWVFIDGVQTVDGSEYPLNNQFFTLADVSPLGVTLNDLFGGPIDASHLPAILNPSGGTVSRVFTLATPYAAADLALVKFTQSADTMTLCHTAYAPQQLTRTGHANWTITAASFVPTAPSPQTTGATPSLTGDATQYAYVVTAVTASGTESLPSNVATAINSKTMSQTQGANITIQWQGVTGAVNYNVYRQAEVSGGAAGASQLFGFVGSTTGTATSFVDANISPDFSRTPPQNFNPFASGNNPGCVSYFQSREIFAGSTAQPQTFWTSKSADFLNFGFSEPSRPNDSIIGTIAAQRVNAIKHIVPMDSMILLTADGAWKVDAGQLGGAISPSAVEAVPQAYNGCSDVPPITINQDILYVQNKGSIVRDLAYNFYVKIYTGSDLTALSNHLFFGHRIREWAWAEEPFKLIWCVREDGKLLTFTYLKEQEVYAWAHSDTQGQFQSVCAVSEGNEDAVYFVVARAVNGRWVQYIERLASRQLGAVPEQGVPADWSRFWFVDCGLQHDLTFPAATITPSKAEGSPGIVGATVVNGGSGYSAPMQIAESVIAAGPSITVTDRAGSGASLVPTVVGGVITAVQATATGSGYIAPVLTVTDATGAGAILSPTISFDVDMQSDLEVFSSVAIGDLFIGGGGWGYVRRINSARSITVNLIQKLASAFPIAPGAWSVTPPISTVRGLNHLEGCTVTGLADGNVISPRVVSDGAITLDRPASAIVVGLPYVAQLESLDMDVPGEAATVQGKRKTISALTVRQQDSRGIKVGRNFDEMKEFKERTTEAMGVPAQAFTGDLRVVVPAQYDVPGRVCVQADQPLPATVLAFIPEVAIGDTQ